VLPLANGLVIPGDSKASRAHRFGESDASSTPSRKPMAFRTPGTVGCGVARYEDLLEDPVGQLRIITSRKGAPGQRFRATGASCFGSRSPLKNS
jgi:hypothetical protein